MKLYKFLILKAVTVSFYTVIAALAFQYVLQLAIGKDVAWYADVAVGFFFGWLVIPLSVIGWVVSLCGVATPFFQNT